MGFIMIFIEKRPSLEDDLVAIEACMHEIVDRDEEIVRSVWTRDEAVDFYKRTMSRSRLNWLRPSPAMNPSRSIARETLLIFAVGRICHLLASWAMRSN